MRFEKTSHFFTNHLHNHDVDVVLQYCQVVKNDFEKKTPIILRKTTKNGVFDLKSGILLLILNNDEDGIKKIRFYSCFHIFCCA